MKTITLPLNRAFNFGKRVKNSETFLKYFVGLCCTPHPTDEIEMVFGVNIAGVTEYLNWQYKE